MVNSFLKEDKTMLFNLKLYNFQLHIMNGKSDSLACTSKSLGKKYLSQFRNIILQTIVRDIFTYMTLIHWYEI